MTASFNNLIKQSLYAFVLLSLTACNSITPTLPTSKPTIPYSSTAKIILLLPMEGKYALAAQVIRDGFIASAYAAESHPDIEIIDNTQFNTIQSAYAEAVARQAQIIVGPLAKSDVASLARQSSLPVLTLALNTVETNQRLPAKLYQFGLAPTFEAQQVAKQAWQDGHQQAVIIAPREPWGRDIAAAFQHSFTQQGGEIVASLAFDKQRDLHQQIQALVAQLSAHQAAGLAFLLAADPSTARRLHATLKSAYLPSEGNVYATSLVYTGIPNSSTDEDLNNINVCDMPWVLDNANSLRQQIHQLWPELFSTQPRLYGFGIDAYKIADNLRQADDGFLANFHMLGVTGNLSLNAERQVQRQLTCAKFQQGVPVITSPAISAL